MPEHKQIYIVIPREMPHCSENACVFVPLEFKEKGLWSHITLVYLVSGCIKNLRKEGKQVSEILILIKVCLSCVSPRSWGYMPHP
jgi:hypothetical protein